MLACVVSVPLSLGAPAALLPSGSSREDGGWGGKVRLCPLRAPGPNLSPIIPKPNRSPNPNSVSRGRSSPCASPGGKVDCYPSPSNCSSVDNYFTPSGEDEEDHMKNPVDGRARRREKPNPNPNPNPKQPR
ncbi:unnamed protein product, partial [Discosporangium mesarthrocarpum]